MVSVYAHRVGVQLNDDKTNGRNAEHENAGGTQMWACRMDGIMQTWCCCCAGVDPQFAWLGIGRSSKTLVLIGGLDVYVYERRFSGFGTAIDYAQPDRCLFGR